MELKAQKREKFGKIVSTLRATGLIPAELYGKGVNNLHLTLGKNEFKKVYKLAGENTVVTIVVDGNKFPTIIHDVSHDYLTSEPTHVDLYQVRMDEKIQTKVPLEFIGESSAVKNGVGILVKALHELPVEALPGDLPHSIKVEVSGLAEVGNSISVKDLPIPSDVKVLIDANFSVVTIKAKMTEEQEAALQAAGNLEEVKVESEEKKAEREAAKAATEAAPEAVAKLAK